MGSIQILWLVGEVENGFWTWSLEEILVPVYNPPNDSDMPFSVALQKMWLGNGEWMWIYHILMISYISRAIQSAEADQSMWNSELEVLPSVLGMYHVFHSSSAAVRDLSEERTHLYFTSSPSPMEWRRTVIGVKVKHILLAIQDEMRTMACDYLFSPWIVERWSWGGGGMTGAMSAEREVNCADIFLLKWSN